MDYISNGNVAVNVEVSEACEKNNAVMNYGKEMVSAVNAKQKKASEGKKSVRDRLK